MDKDRTFTLSAPRTEAEFEAYYDLRWRVLRAPWAQPRGSERDEFEEVADHVTAVDPEGRLIGVGSLRPTGQGEARIRYMAIEEAWRGRGVGRAILARLEAQAQRRSVSRILLNAREGVIGFYERMGYSVAGEAPTLFGVIRHSRMEKQLPPEQTG
jgi:N-acetylglutamate synthase-like GNAT family acetyltransferase